MRVRAPIALLIIGAALLAVPAADGATYSDSAWMPSAQELVDTIDCQEAAPDGAAVAGLATDDGQEVELAVRVLLDGVRAERGAAVMERAAVAYEAAGVNLTATFKRVSFKKTDARAMIAEAKQYFDGQRREGVDVVYVLTAKDLFVTNPVDGSEVDIAGLADCAGGVRYPHHAFAVGEDFEEDAEVFFPSQYDDATAEIAAHEVGHLMGAHHHYANCAESAVPFPKKPLRTVPCTLMSNSVGLMTLDISSLNTAVIRGHAVEYASP